MSVDKGREKRRCGFDMSVDNGREKRRCGFDMSVDKGREKRRCGFDKCVDNNKVKRRCGFDKSVDKGREKKEGVAVISQLMTRRGKKNLSLRSCWLSRVGIIQVPTIQLYHLIASG